MATFADMPVSVSTQLVPSVVHSTVVVWADEQVPSDGPTGRIDRQRVGQTEGDVGGADLVRAVVAGVGEQQGAEVALDDEPWAHTSGGSPMVSMGVSTSPWLPE